MSTTLPVRQPDEGPDSWARRVYQFLVSDPYATGYFDDDALGLAFRVSGQAVTFPDLAPATRERLQDVRRILGAALRGREADHAWRQAMTALRARQAERQGKAPDLPGGARMPIHPAPLAPSGAAGLSLPRPAVPVTADPF